MLKLVKKRKPDSFSIRSEAAEPMHHLVHRLSLPGALGKPVRVVAFIAARSGEGTSTVARGYAEALAQETAQKIIVVDAALSPEAPRQQPAYGVVDAMLTGRTAVDAVQTVGSGIAYVKWLGNSAHRASAIKMMQDNQWQKSLLESFDAIVIDAPALQHGFDGILLAAGADTSVIVVEAEKTPQPVIENLRNTLFSAGAAIAGAVMNKRRYYIPEKVYRKL